ncbi:MAG: hypothetical protein PHU25_13695 [Deltaproteobacteria bacterium]|nr:hypothetical protein [Deltaproteobacteria bacterium]
MHNHRMTGTGLLALGALLAPAAARANESYSPWVHELIQKGQDVEITVQVFEDASIELAQGVPLPDLSSRYRLWRDYDVGSETLFKDRVFTAEEAINVPSYGCQVPPDFDMSECEESPEVCVDCDSDAVPECPGFCAVAYQFLVADECVPPGEWYYWMSTPEADEHGLYYEGEGLGFTNTVVKNTGDPCLDQPAADSGPALDGSSGTGCNVSGLGSPRGQGVLFVLMLGIGLAALRVKSRSR